MPNVANLWIILLVVVCAAFIIAKLLRVEKVAVVVGLCALIIWLILYLTGYDRTLYRIIFNAPHVQPEDYRYR